MTEITPEKWQRAKAVFDAVLQQAPVDRASFLARVCPEDDLRAQVEELLRNHEQAGALRSSLSRLAPHRLPAVAVWVISHRSTAVASVRITLR